MINVVDYHNWLDYMSLLRVKQLNILFDLFLLMILHWLSIGNRLTISRLWLKQRLSIWACSIVGWHLMSVLLSRLLDCLIVIGTVKLAHGLLLVPIL